MAALSKTQVFLGHKISYCEFWHSQWLVFWPKYPGSKIVVPEFFDTLEDAKAFISEHDEEPENGLMKYLAK